MHEIDLNEIRKVLKYDPETGHLHRTFSRTNTRWIGAIAGCRSSHGYTIVRFRKMKLAGHRVAFALGHGRWPIGEIDHINGIRSDNRLVNLREANRSQQTANTKVKSTSKLGVKGVRPMRDKFQARIHRGGRQVSLGVFNTIEEAVDAYRIAAEEVYGEFARIK